MESGSVNPSISLKRSHQHKNPSSDNEGERCDGKTTAKPLCKRGTQASCSLDQLQQGYLTPSPPHQWAHRVDGEGLHQSNTTPHGTQALSPLGNTWETEPKRNRISTNEPLDTVHLECRNKKTSLKTPCWYRWAHFLGKLWRRKKIHRKGVNLCFGLVSRYKMNH